MQDGHHETRTRRRPPANLLPNETSRASCPHSDMEADTQQLDIRRAPPAKYTGTIQDTLTMGPPTGTANQWTPQWPQGRLARGKELIDRRTDIDERSQQRASQRPAREEAWPARPSGARATKNPGR